MNLALGVKKLFDEVGIVHPNPSEIDRMSDEELLSVLRERNVLIRIIEWYAQQQSKLNHQHSASYWEMKDRIRAVLPGCDV